MMEFISIDFRPGSEAVPKILDMVDQEGFTLRGLRLVPTRACDRATLRLDLGNCPSRDALDMFGDQLSSLDEIIEPRRMRPALIRALHEARRERQDAVMLEVADRTLRA